MTAMDDPTPAHATGASALAGYPVAHPSPTSVPSSRPISGSTRSMTPDVTVCSSDLWKPTEREPWPLRAATIVELDDDLLAASGIQPTGEPLVKFAEDPRDLAHRAGLDETISR